MAYLTKSERSVWELGRSKVLLKAQCGLWISPDASVAKVSRFNYVTNHFWTSLLLAATLRHNIGTWRLLKKDDANSRWSGRTLEHDG